MKLDFSPTFIIGVPRSGTTLLRVLLDSHSQVAGAPETSWITGGYTDFSIRQLVESLEENKVGASKNLSGVDSAVLYDSARQFLKTLLSAYLEERKKKYLVLKTPDDIRYLDFLVKLFPNSRFIHIYRDGRDVACSTYAKKGEFFGEKILLEFGEFTQLNVLRRWCDWEQKIRKKLEGRNTLSISYEKLIAEPVKILQELTGFLGVPFEQEMIDYSAKDHEYPSWEAGSYDVKQKSEIDKGSVQRWINEIPYKDWEFIDQQYGSFLSQLGYETCEQVKNDRSLYIFEELTILRTKLQESESKVAEFQDENKKLQSFIDEITLEVENLKKENPLKINLQDNIILWLRTENSRLERLVSGLKKEKNIIEQSKSFKLGRVIIIPVKKTVDLFHRAGRKISSIIK